MANAPFPASINADPLVRAYSDQIPIDFEESPTDSKKPRRIALNDGPVRVPITFDLPVNRAQLKTLRTWVRETLVRGALPFDFTHPELLETLTFYIRDGANLAIRPDGNGVNWLVRMELEYEDE